MEGRVVGMGGGGGMKGYAWDGGEISEIFRAFVMLGPGLKWVKSFLRGLRSKTGIFYHLHFSLSYE